MPDLKTVLTETLRAHRHRGFRAIDNGPYEDDVMTAAVLCKCGEDFHAPTGWQAADAHESHLADALLSLPGVAVTQLPDAQAVVSADLLNRAAAILDRWPTTAPPRSAHPGLARELRAAAVVLSEGETR